MSFLYSGRCIIASLLLVTSVFSSSVSFSDPSPGRIYSNGSYDVDTFDLPGRSFLVANAKNRPPKALFVVVPRFAASFPVIQLQHGYMQRPSYYSQLMKHISSHGFIVVAPLMYTATISSDTRKEIASVADVLNWLPVNLVKALPSSVLATPDFTKVSLVGHSRGGKVSFAVALGHASVNYPLSAIVGIDPVAGTSDYKESNPLILTGNGRSFNLSYPSLILGSGLGSVQFYGKRCVPLGLGHQHFYNDSSAPAYHFVAPNYGHMDYLDDKLYNLFGWLGTKFCKAGSTNGPERIFAGGIIVAFLQSALFGESTNLEDAIQNYKTHIPIIVDPPEVLDVGKSAETY